MMAITGTRGIADVELRSGLRMAFGVALSVLVSLGCTSCSSDEASLECNGNGQDIDAGVGEDGGIGEADAGTGDNDDIDGIPLLVETQSGPVRGLAADSSRVFRAIRYAAPPVGPLRFAAPQPPEPWEQAPEPELNACPQRGVEGLIGAEDCLMLEVWTPLHETATPLPVMVWIHGGGYTAGSGYLTDGMLPTREVVLVSINYRLGPLGFLAHPDLSAEGGGTSGNYGIQDQQLALQWVQDNVSAFGGDPEQVTIFGESAGGSAVGAHIWSSRSTGLFHRAIMQSGTGFRRQPRTLDDAEAQGERLVEALSCDADVSAVECLREVPLETLFNALSVASWRPSFDGVVFERDLFDMIEDGTINMVPTMIGSNTYEGLGFMLERGDLTEEEYVALIENSSSYGEYSEELLSIYSVTDYLSAQLAYAAVVGHGRFNCPARRAARALAEAGGDVFLYLYDYGLALHAAELGLLFGVGMTPSDQRVSAAMKDYWTQFAKTGDPNTGTLPEWPRYQVDTDQHLNIADPITAGSELLREECDLWDEIAR